MAIAFRAAGAQDAGVLTCNPGHPASTANNDGLIAVVSGTGNTAFTVGGGGTWSLLGAVNLSATRRLEIHSSRFVSGDTTPTFTLAASNVIHGVILGWSGVKTTGSFVDQVSAENHGTGTTPTFGDGTPTVANTEYVMARGGQNTTGASYSGTNPTPTERFDNSTSTGSGSSIQVASGAKTDTTAWGSRTMTTGSSAWGSFAFNLLPEITSVPSLVIPRRGYRTPLITR